MAMLNFVDTFELMAFNFHGDEEQHHRFVHDAKKVIDAVVGQLKINESLFHDYLGQLRKTAAFVSQINMDMPLSFEVFLTIRLPIALTPSYNEEQRSVQLSRSNYTHPFFFGNLLNTKCMNMRLQQDLQRATAQVGCIAGYWGAIYDIKYTSLSYNNVPFAHQVIASERGTINRGIRFDFILAVEFDGAEMPLPPYYDAPISYKWFAYGLVAVNQDHSSADWGVLLPRWQTADMGVRLRTHNMLLLLHRLLYSQGCFCFAVPFLVKFCFFMTTVDRGENYKQMNVADLMITTLGHQVFRNFCDLIVHSSTGDHANNTAATRELHEQQVRGKGLFSMLAKGLKLNLISSEFLTEYFQIDNLSLSASPAKKARPTPKEPPQEVSTPTRKRRRSI